MHPKAGVAGTDGTGKRLIYALSGNRDEAYLAEDLGQRDTVDGILYYRIKWCCTGEKIWHPESKIKFDLDLPPRRRNKTDFLKSNNEKTNATAATTVKKDNDSSKRTSTTTKKKKDVGNGRSKKAARKSVTSETPPQCYEIDSLLKSGSKRPLSNDLESAECEYQIESLSQAPTEPSTNPSLKKATHEKATHEFPGTKAAAVPKKIHFSAPAVVATTTTTTTASFNTISTNNDEIKDDNFDNKHPLRVETLPDDEKEKLRQSLIRAGRDPSSIFSIQNIMYVAPSPKKKKPKQKNV